MFSIDAVTRLAMAIATSFSLSLAGDAGTVTKSVPAAHMFVAGQPYPQWSGDIFISRSAESLSYADPSARLANLFDSSGKLIGSPSFWIEGSARIAVRGMAAGPGKQLAIAGHATSNSGQVIGFVALSDFTGKARLTILTTPFVPEHVCFGADGDIWALVAMIDMDGSKRGQQYSVLRKFSGTDGKLQFHAISSTGFARELPPVLTSGPGEEVLMQTNGSGAGIYFAHSNRWVEVTNSGSVSTIVAPVPRGTKRDGSPLGRPKTTHEIAYMDGGGVYADFSDEHDGGLYKLDKASGNWIAVPGTHGASDSAPVAILLGRDSSGNILFQSKTPGRAGNSIYWAGIE